MKLTHGENPADIDMEAGIYTWSLADDRLYGDTAIAALFGLDPLQTIRGLPLSSYIDRVHVSDQPLLTALIAKAVQDGLPYSAEYRVRNALNEFEFVMAVGRCFRDPAGNPSLYSGIIYPVRGLQ
ncbi:PAS domain-containing protein [Agrobacterium rosae]|nr:PAS domain-containing protein [Agrobacterium rosae]MCM2435347.1 PAS domain-containing protein [Agrobacterium rosae]MDX8332217.1 PAS domain-containing protein [Agrobacterium rosae]